MKASEKKSLRMCFSVWRRIWAISSNPHFLIAWRQREDPSQCCALKKKSEGKNLRGEKIMIKPAPAQQSLKTWRDIHNVRSTSHLSFVYSLSLSPPFSGGAREHDMAYLTQITALCQTSHFLLDMQAASWDKQTPTDAHTQKAGAEKHSKTWSSLPFQTPEKQMKLFPFFFPQKEGAEGRGEEILSDHNHMKLQEDLSVWRIETTMLKGAGGHGGGRRRLLQKT